MKNNKEDFEEKTLAKLSAITELLENLLILQGGIAGIKKQELRKIAGVAMNRVTKVTRFIKEPKPPKKPSKQ
jgi:hypothetical protein